MTLLTGPDKISVSIPRTALRVKEYGPDAAVMPIPPIGLAPSADLW